MSLNDQYQQHAAEELKKDVAAYSEKELLYDLEFAVRRHIDQKAKETADQVRFALRRLDAKRGRI